MRPEALICTVGTSMFAAAPALRELPVEDAARRLAAMMRPAEGGAEHESLAWLLRHPDRLEPTALHLIASDTDAGEQAARVLEARFVKDFVHVSRERCVDLREDAPHLFAARGLRRLVNTLVEQVQRFRKQGLQPAIDATGGYKPQIAYATLVGQIMQVPVYYRHQAFPEVMTLQPLPVSVDVQVWFDHLWFFDRLRRDFGKPADIPKDDPRIAPLIHREDRLVMLSPLGELMAAAVDRLFETSPEAVLPPASPLTPEAKKMTFEDGNAGRHRGLREFCERLARVPYVVRMATYYYNPDLPKRSGIGLDPDGQVVDRLDVWYGDGAALTKLRLWTTARTAREAAAARAHLAAVIGIAEL